MPVVPSYFLPESSTTVSKTLAYLCALQFAQFNVWPTCHLALSAVLMKSMYCGVISLNLSDF